MPAYFEQDAGQTGGLHALIIGISDYPDAAGRPENFRLGTVDGPALSAWRLCQLLMNPPVGSEWVRPLRTIRLLLAPSEGDARLAPDLAAGVAAGTIARPTFDAVNAAADAWRQDCDRGDDEAALFFFSGHGVRYNGADCLVCADFGIRNTPNQILLDRCIRFDSLFNQAMAGPTFGQGIARRQFWFVDACRVETTGVSPNPVGSPRDILNPRLEDGVPMQRTGLWSTGGAHFARADGPDGATPFGAALLGAIQGAVDQRIGWPTGGAAQDVWPVTGYTIKTAVTALLGRDPKTAGQVPTQFGFGGDDPILRFRIDRPPEVRATIRVRPPGVPSRTRCLLQRVDGPPPEPIRLDVIDPHPFVTATLSAGTYSACWTVGDAPEQQRGWFLAFGRDELIL